MKKGIADWLTRDAVEGKENRLILHFVSCLMRNRSMTEDEALTALEVSRERYERARGNKKTVNGQAERNVL